MCFQDKNILKTQSPQQHCQIDTKPCPHQWSSISMSWKMKTAFLIAFKIQNKWQMMCYLT
jgi:hypothetical protein